MTWLPSSLESSDAHIRYLRSLAEHYVRNRGNPDIMLTLTYSSSFTDESDSFTLSDRGDEESIDKEDPYIRPLRSARIFRVRVKEIMARLVRGELFGPIEAYL